MALSFMVHAAVNKRRALKGRITGMDFRSRRYPDKRKSVIESSIHSVSVIPIFSIVARGSDAARQVRVSVREVRNSSNRAIRTDRKATGQVIKTSKPVITTKEDKGTIIMFVIMNHTGNLLKSITVSGRVPACATIVTAADCQSRSGIRCENLNLR